MTLKHKCLHLVCKSEIYWFFFTFKKKIFEIISFSFSKWDPLPKKRKFHGIVQPTFWCSGKRNWWVSFQKPLKNPLWSLLQGLKFRLPVQILCLSKAYFQRWLRSSYFDGKPLCDMWHLMCDMWHLTCETWQMTHTLTVWKRRCFEDIFSKDDLFS